MGRHGGCEIVVFGTVSKRVSNLQGLTLRSGIVLFNTVSEVNINK